MTALIDWSDVNKRYPETAKVADATQADSSWVMYAIAELHARLAPGFTVPFSTNNLTAKDLAIDLTFAKYYRWKDQEKAAAVSSFIAGQIDGLLAGSLQMITTSGDLLAASGGVIHVTNGGYHPVFGISPVELSVPSSAQILAEESDRGVL